MRAVRDFDRSDVAAALAIGSIGLLMLGAQPVVLGELVERKVISLEGVGLVAMGEIIAIGVGVALGDALLATTRMRFVAIVAALSRRCSISVRSPCRPTSPLSSSGRSPA